MTQWTAGSYEASGVKIHYRRTGGAKPPLVLLHGLGGSGACWTLLARTLEADYDVVMPDARGHGGSSAPPQGYRYEDHAADAIGLMQGLGLAAPLLLGHSMGGMTAAVIASQTNTAIRGVVLEDPAFLSAERQHEVHQSDVAEQHRRILNSGLKEVLAQARARHPHRAPELIELIAEAKMRTSLAAFEVLTPPNPDFRRLVSGLHVPALLVISDQGVVSRATAEELQKLNPRLRIEEIRDADHGLHFDQPERFAAAVGAFLQTVP